MLTNGFHFTRSGCVTAVDTLKQLVEQHGQALLSRQRHKQGVGGIIRRKSHFGRGRDKLQLSRM